MSAPASSVPAAWAEASATSSVLITRPRNSGGVAPSSTVISPAVPAAMGRPTRMNSTR